MLELLYLPLAEGTSTARMWARAMSRTSQTQGVTVSFVPSISPCSATGRHVHYMATACQCIHSFWSSSEEKLYYAIVRCRHESPIPALLLMKHSYHRVQQNDCGPLHWVWHIDHCSALWYRHCRQRCRRQTHSQSKHTHTHTHNCFTPQCFVFSCCDLPRHVV